MIHGLIQGELSKDPQQRTTQDGQAFAFTSVRAGAGDEAVFIGVSIFGTAGAEKLMTLRKGDSIGATGQLKMSIWTGKDGQERRGWNLTATQIITVYEATKRRKRAQDDQDNGGNVQ